MDHRFLRFILVVTVVMVPVHLYLYRRLVRDVTERRGWRLLAAVPVVLFFGGVVYSRVMLVGSPDGRWGSLLASFWMGLVLYLLLCTLVLDGLRWLWKRQRPVDEAALQSPERRRLLALGAGVGGVAFSIASTRSAFVPPELSEVVVKLPGLPKALEGFTLVQLSDIHIGSILQRPFLQDLVERANALKPDLLAITGDLVDGPVELLERHVSVLTSLKSRFGTHFCTGNHDYYSGADEWVAYLERIGVTVLRNRFVPIGDAGASFDLVGVDDWSAHRVNQPGYDLGKALEGRDPERPSVLLAHQPANFDEVAQRGLGLQLSGHTHGGQLFPATGVARLIWGERTTGLSSVGDSQLYVSRGCGFVGPPMRLGSPPELVKVVLVG